MDNSKWTNLGEGTLAIRNGVAITVRQNISGKNQEVILLDDEIDTIKKMLA